jgi:hypothetical protein
MAFNLPYVYDYITDYAGNEQKSYKIMRMNTVAGEARPRKYERLKLGGGQTYMTIQMTKLPL